MEPEPESEEIGSKKGPEWEILQNSPEFHSEFTTKPLTSLVGECGQTKVTKAKGTRKVPWYWVEVHQKAFSDIKATIAKEVVLAYMDFDKIFEITVGLYDNSVQ